MTGDLSQLIDRYLDGAATPAESATLEIALDRDAALIDALAARAALTADLRRVTTRSASTAARPDAFKPDPSPPRAKVRVPEVPSSGFRVPRFIYPLAAALLLAAAVVAIYVFALNSKPETRNPKPDTPVATITDSSGGATVIINDAVASPGDEVRSGDVTLDTGSAEFRLNSGVTVRLTGPTQLTVIDDMSSTLTHGSARFDCPHAARGYTVHLPGGARVVDLGTRFSVHVNDAGRTRVRVLAGRVSVTAGDRSVELADAGSISIADGKLGSVIADQDLAAHYAFDGDGRDEVSGAEGLVGPQVSFVPGVIGSAAVFPHSDDPDAVGIRVPQPDVFNPGTGSFSVAFWLKRDQASHNAWVFTVRDEPEIGYTMYFTVQQTLRFGFGAGGVTTATQFTDTADFHHYAFTVERRADDAEVKFYLDGELKETLTAAKFPAATPVRVNGDMLIGAPGSKLPTSLKGKLDDLRFYGGVLDADRIRELAEPINGIRSNVGPDERDSQSQSTRRTPETKGNSK